MYLKKLLGIIVIGLLWCSAVYPDDLKGIKIFCQPDNTPVMGSKTNSENYMSFEFEPFSRVKVIDISPYAGEYYLSKESYTVSTHKYETTVQQIIIKNFKHGDLEIVKENITLLTYQKYLCNFTSKEENLKKKMKNIHNNLKKSDFGKL